MLLSKELLLKEAKRSGYKIENLEKVYLLLTLLEQFMSVPFLQERFALKGGTALNIFCFDEIPRLSVDIDLNYIGHIDKEKMLEERKLIDDAIYQIFKQNKFDIYRNTSQHAGGKIILQYESALAQKGKIEVDLNYMYRQPLFPIKQQTSKLLFNKAVSVPMLDIHELAAGKLSALFSRRASRDFFDAHHLLISGKLSKHKLRLAFVIYLAMTNIPLSDLNVEKIQYDFFELKTRLLPVLRQSNIPKTPPAVKKWGDKLLFELKESLKIIFPLEKHEIDFIQQIRVNGKILPEIITDDSLLMKVIQQHPAIVWNTIKQ